MRALRCLLESWGKRGEDVDDDADAVVEDGENDDKWDRVLVFVATQHKAKQVSKKLRCNGIPALELQCKLEQSSDRGKPGPTGPVARYRSSPPLRNRASTSWK
jgi:hypothetical protein